jgi:ABC-type lipoprotein release transport system permease subunit
VRRLSSLAWRSLGARKLRSFLSMAGIALGVAVLFASLSAGATMDAAVDKAAADEMGHRSARPGSRGEGLSRATVDVIAGAAGVSVAAPALERKTYLRPGPTRRRPRKLPPPVTVLGIDPVLEPQLHDMPLASGRLLTAGDVSNRP